MTELTAQHSPAKAGDVFIFRLPLSASCVYLEVCGQERPVKVVGEAGCEAAQILRHNGQPFAAPITMGEAGFRFVGDSGWHPPPSSERLR